LVQFISVRSARLGIVLGSLAALAACHDGGTAPVIPASIEIGAGNNQTGSVGQRLTTSPTFVVRAANGRALSGVGVSVAISAGEGSVANAPKKSGNGPTSIGAWTLGVKTGVNQVTVTVSGLTPIVFSATANAGAAAKITTAMPTTFSARVGEVASPAPVATVTDTYGNPVANASVHASASGGSVASAAMVSNADGRITVSDWTLRQKVGQDVLTLTSGSASLSFTANAEPGDPAKVITVSGDGQSALAGTAIGAPIVVRVTDRFDNTILGQTATFTVTSGGGSIQTTSAASDASGLITLPSWTLGRTALPQVVRVTAGQASGDVSALVHSDFHIDVRFFGPGMTDAQKALFTNAAARISALVTGDIADVPLANFDVGGVCGFPELPVLNETIDDLVIYASVQDIDGPGKILAQAGPCAFRGGSQGYLTTVGIMEFDVADLDRIGGNGTLQDVITHEMLHVLGIGTLWYAQGLTQNEGTPMVSYQGAAGRKGCLDDGGLTTCSAGVPVENNGVPGTADAHWRESVFQSELMTGYVNAGGMPLSSITAGSLQDMGYTVNMLAVDPFRVPVTPSSSNVVPGDMGWERPLPGPGAVVSPTGTAVLLKRP
jgi:hypothetical protein